MLAKCGNGRLGKTVANIDRGSDGSEAGYSHSGEHNEMSEIGCRVLPSAMATDIAPGPTVSGMVSG